MKATTSSRPIPLLLKMKFRATHLTHLFLLLVLAAMAAVISGCASTESDNTSVRPWNSPEGWEGGMLGDMNQQHR